MLGFQIHGNLLPFVPCLLSPSPTLRLPKSQAGCSWYCPDSQRPQVDGVSFPIRAVGLHWGSDLNDWASKARTEALRNREDLHTPPPPRKEPPRRSLPRSRFARRQLSHSVETPLGRTTQLLLPEAWFALNSLTGPLRP